MNTQFYRYSYGFSLIELMIVITIMGILAVIAIPSYQNYVQRARFAEVITMTEPFKLAISIALQEGAALSELENGTHDIPLAPQPTTNLASLIVKAGIITATATTKAGDGTYILTPNLDGGPWQISGSCLTLGLCHAAS